MSTRLGSEVTARLVEPMLGRGVCRQGGSAEPADDGTGVVPGGDPASRSALQAAAASAPPRGRNARGPRKGPIFVGIDLSQAAGHGPG